MCVNTGKYNVFQSLHVHKNYPVKSMHFPTFFRNGEFEKISRRFTFHCRSVNLGKTTCIIPFTAVLRIPFQLCSQELTSRNHAFSGIFCNGEFVQGMHFPAFTTARLIENSSSSNFTSWTQLYCRFSKHFVLFPSPRQD